MKKAKLLLLISSLVFVPVLSLTSCGNNNESTEQTGELVDYVDQLKFDYNSGRKYVETTVYKCIDGDTTHFNVADVPNGIYKARYLGIDTPESTGAIEPWGKEASKFTSGKLTSAASVIVESNVDHWELDSTGRRYLTWVWYKPTADSDYRLLNLEIVQEGLSMLKNAASTIYGDYFTKAFQQALSHKLKLVGNNKDPNYYYGGPVEATIAEVVLHKDTYNGNKVRVEGLVTKVDNMTFYIEAKDDELNQIFGVQVYMHYNFAGAELIQEGNWVSVCGVYSYSDVVSSWQISDLKYLAMMPNNPLNTKLIQEGLEVVPTLIDGTYLNGQTTLTFIDEETEKSVDVTYDNSELLMDTKVRMENLKVEKVYTTNNGGDNDGALTLTCKDANGVTVTVRTSVLYNNLAQVITADAYENKNITVEGIVDSYDGKCQIHVFFGSDIVVL